MFAEQFEKTAVLGSAVLGGAAGAALGGEDDHERGGRKSRYIGALRGAALLGGSTLGMKGGKYVGTALAGKSGRELLAKALKNKGHAAILTTKKDAAEIAGKQLAGELVGSVGGAVAGYKGMKAAGPKYEREKKNH